VFLDAAHAQLELSTDACTRPALGHEFENIAFARPRSFS
jgi:hypothetical protein